MATRMEKYAHNRDKKTGKSRSSRNQDLYSNIYTYSKYSNIEGIADIENNNQVDITKVRELLESREKQLQRKYRRFSDYKETKKEPQFSKRFPELEEKNYDIRDILKEARENKEPDDKERVLKNTQYNILKNIDLKKEVKKEDYYDEKDEDDLKEMIQTITNTSMLNKMNKDFTSTDLLSDMKDDDTKVGELNNVKNLINENQGKTRQAYDSTNYDRSFFTSSLKLSKSDFVDGNKKGSIFNTIIITILIVVMIVSATILIMKMFF